LSVNNVEKLFFYIVFLFSRCVGICPEGTYLSVEDKLCLPCHSQCGSCRNASENSCIGCKPGFFLVHDTMICAESCPDRYYTGKEIH
jgi:hypothetical protein